VTPATHWRIGPERVLDLSVPRLMGILNVTPDSFSDGGCFEGVDAAVSHARGLVQGGASIIDVGGESTRPGASRVSGGEQIERVRPVIHAIRSVSDIPLSVDTTRAEVAEACLDAGADIINDVSAGLEDAAMLPLAASRGCGVVLMHRLRPPDEDCWSDAYEQDPDYGEAVTATVTQWLLDRAAAAEATGVAGDAICLDPGLGFGKSVAQNWSLIAGTGRLVATGYPILAAASRKSFIGAVTGLKDPARRDAASATVSALQVAAGARLLRVHDVPGHARAIEPWLAARTS